MRSASAVGDGQSVSGGCADCGAAGKGESGCTLGCGREGEDELSCFCERELGVECTASPRRPVCGNISVADGDGARNGGGTADGAVGDTRDSGSGEAAARRFWSRADPAVEAASTCSSRPVSVMAMSVSMARQSTVEPRMIMSAVDEVRDGRPEARGCEI